MKHLILIALLLISGNLFAQGGGTGDPNPGVWTVNLTWDVITNCPACTAVRIYEITGTPQTPIYTLKATTSMPSVLAEVPDVVPGIHTYIGRTTDEMWESLDSNTASTPAQTPPLNNFRLVMKMLPNGTIMKIEG